jgi:hypothetical protein
MSEGEVRMWNGHGWYWAPPPSPKNDWEILVSDVLTLLSVRAITPNQAMSWLWMLVELEEARS